jgi:anti-sigma regulatory factor (Ser/Thr protein kinase)
MPKDPNAAPARFEITLSRPEENPAALLTAIEQYGLERALSHTLRYRLGVIVDELVTNAILHGGCTGEQQTLSVSVVDRPDELIVEIIDTGRLFDPTTHVLSCCHEGEQVPIGGVGLCLVRHLASRMEYTRHKNRNRLLIFINKTKPEDVCSLKK